LSGWALSKINLALSNESDVVNSTSDETLSCRPLLKWAGGKTQLLREIIPKMPKVYRRYIEPFFGGGAVFLLLDLKMGLLQIVILNW